MNFKPVFLFLLVAILVSCNSENQAQTSSNATTQAKPTAVVFKSNGINTIYTAYSSLRDALVATDFETVKKHAVELQQALTSESSAQSSTEIVSSIASAKNITVARQEFSKLNASIEPLFRINIESGELNKAYCPMALNNTGAYWFTNNKEILNPYFGDQMLKCGMIKETIVSE